MTLKRVFLVHCELGAESPSLKSEGFAGAFVTCIVPTDSIRAAIDLAEITLDEDGYSVIDIDKVLESAPDDWGHDEDFKSEAVAASLDGEVRYGPFDVWGH